MQIRRYSRFPRTGQPRALPSIQRLLGSYLPLTLQLLFLFAMPSHQLLLLIKPFRQDWLHDRKVAQHSLQNNPAPPAGWHLPLSPGAPLARLGPSPAFKAVPDLGRVIGKKQKAEESCAHAHSLDTLSFERWSDRGGDRGEQQEGGGSRGKRGNVPWLVFCSLVIYYLARATWPVKLCTKLSDLMWGAQRWHSENHFGS